jgi:hypothetical protein
VFQDEIKNQHYINPPERIVKKKNFLADPSKQTVFSNFVSLTPEHKTNVE